METGRASKTALRVAIRRAHQLADRPGYRTIRLRCGWSAGFARDLDRAMEKVRRFRAFMAAPAVRGGSAGRRRWPGVEQYVVLGAGLDTFAYRNPFPSLRVFEVDFPATQEWKRELLRKAGIAVPDR